MRTPKVDLDAIRWPQSIRGINSLDREMRDEIYLSLIPDAIFERFKVDPYDRELLRINGPHDTRSVEIVMRHRPDAHDPVFFLHMADTLNYQIACCCWSSTTLTPRASTWTSLPRGYPPASAHSAVTSPRKSGRWRQGWHRCRCGAACACHAR